MKLYNSNTYWRALLVTCLFMYHIGPVRCSGCPAVCRCTQKDFEIGVMADCSGQRITDLQSIVSQLSSSTTILDLRLNQIQIIPTDSFSALSNLSVILLDNNLIEQLEPHAFRGLHNLRTIRLVNNHLKKIGTESFAGISGDAVACGSDMLLIEDGTCGIFLQENPIERIDRHAFAWMKRLQIVMGMSEVPLDVEAYAFYGARAVPRFVVEHVPRLRLQPRIFTNTENIGTVHISDTEMEKLDGFVFEGLKNVKQIIFSRVRMHQINSFAFSGITFMLPPSSDQRTSANALPQVDTELSNYLTTSSISFVDCFIDDIYADIFRDTQLIRIQFEGNRINRMHGNVFRGVFGLRSINLIRNTISSLEQDSLGSLRKLHELIIHDNNLTIFNNKTFSETNDVGTIRISIRYPTTLEEDAFSGIFSVKNLEIYGSSPSSSNQKPALLVKPGAFRNLVDVEVLRLSDVSLPTLEQQSFSGMTRVRKLLMSNCDISKIDRLTFGSPRSGQYGAIEHIDMSVGNNITCNCETREVLRELIDKFSSCNIACRTSNDPHAKPVQVSSSELSKLPCSSSAHKSFTVSLGSLAVVVSHLFMLNLRKYIS